MITQENRSDPLSTAELEGIDAYWRASLYLCAGMLYLRDNPLLKEPLEIAHIKKRLLGHWGSDPGQTLIWTHLNRMIREQDLDMIFVSGPGHGAPSVLSHAWMEGTYGEVYPDKGQGEDGLQRFFKQFSFPGGIGSHCTPETPGSLHEGGELGYSLSHAFGVAFDNPDLIVACMVGDGEAETGPLATAWHGTKFLNPARDGAVLPILHLNGYKIANPTLLARIDHGQLESLMRGYGYRPYFVEGDDPTAIHQALAATLDAVVEKIHAIQHQARTQGVSSLPEWPMIVLRTPKGWTGPKEVDGHRVEGFWRAHQIPLDPHRDPAHLRQLEAWLKGYRPERLFTDDGRLAPELAELAPAGHRRMSANPVANGGLLRKALVVPDFRDYAVQIPRPGEVREENTRPSGRLLRDVMRANPDNFRFFCPDETASNRLDDIYQASGKAWMAEILPEDADGTHLARDGRVMEVLSEHTLEGWLEGYLLSGRHGFFASYEAFIHVIGSMFNQHAKWLEKSFDTPWRAPVSALNILVTSTVWRQDHNGFSHQDPGFLDLVTNKSPRVTRIYLPPDANCLLSVVDHCLDSTDKINVVVADKQRHLQYLSMDEAILHCTKGIGIWDWASSDQDSEPDLVMACAGDVPTMEALAATALLRAHFPELKVRFVNVVDLFRLVPTEEHEHGLSDADFDSLFTLDKPVIFNFHGYPWLIHKLTYRRTNSHNIHVRGYKEQGNINTPMDLAIRNQIDRFDLVIDAIDRIPGLKVSGAHAKEQMKNQILECQRFAHSEGQDLPAFADWQWPGR
ncbi:MAG: phosphoketolase family protein [Chromatiaceae bacterium]|jgi:xylulose-5-phosphate/fructose-6-phosphate phosphoketolase|nr:phosphoketolase family protein [Chromatiaceae bacterium]